MPSITVQHARVCRAMVFGTPEEAALEAILLARVAKVGGPRCVACGSILPEDGGSSYCSVSCKRDAYTRMYSYSRRAPQ